MDDETEHTLYITVNKLKNTFDIMYCENQSEIDDTVDFSFRGIPYEISEEWHFQLSTKHHMPFTYNFLLALREFVGKLVEANSSNYNIKVLREIYKIHEPEYN